MDAVVKMPLWQLEELKKAQEVVTPETKLEKLEREFGNYKVNVSNNELYKLQTQVAQLKTENDHLKRKVEELKESLRYTQQQVSENNNWQAQETKNSIERATVQLKNEHKKELREKDDIIMGKDWTLTDLRAKLDRLETKLENNKWRLRGFWARLLNKDPEPTFGWGF